MESLRMPRHLLSIADLSKEEIFSLTDPTFETAASFSAQHRGTLGLLFQQPSLRTMSSFAAAGVSLGLTPISIATTGGEKNLRDRVRWEDEIHQLTLTGSLCVVTRAAKPLVKEDLLRSQVPILNAGDGNNEHPTQGLIDIATLRSHEFEGKNLALMGNLRDHRVFHSLLLALRWFPCKIHLLAPKVLMPDRKYWNELENIKLCPVEDQRQLDVELGKMDFIYMSALEFYNTNHTFEPNMFKLNLEMAVTVLKPEAKILHPFPRFDELHGNLDYTSYDSYHAQAQAAPVVRRRVLNHFL